MESYTHRTYAVERQSPQNVIARRSSTAKANPRTALEIASPPPTGARNDICLAELRNSLTQSPHDVLLICGPLSWHKGQAEAIGSDIFGIAVVDNACLANL